MKSRFRWLAAAAVVAVCGGMAAGLSWHAGEKRAIETLYATTLPDLDSHLQSFSQWRNTTLLINYWATWCEPCREEVPALIRIQTRYSSKNIQIVGIALDSPDRVRGFAKSFGINYPLFIGGTGMIDLMHAQGNAVGALPFTVVVAPGGATTQVHLGALSEQEAESLIARTQAGSGS